MLLELADKADVLVENFSVGVTKRLGIDFGVKAVCVHWTVGTPEAAASIVAIESDMC